MTKTREEIRETYLKRIGEAKATRDRTITQIKVIIREAFDRAEAEAWEARQKELAELDKPS